jgi:hypothetical protein
VEKGCWKKMKERMIEAAGRRLQARRKNKVDPQA